VDCPEFFLVFSAAAAAAAGTGSRGLILEGRATRVPEGYVVRSFLPFPSLEDASLLVPLDRGNVSAYALDTWVFPTSWPRLLRKKLLVSFARPALPLLRRPAITVATRGRAQPLFVAAAAERFALDPEPDWFVVCGQGDELSRGLFVLFPRRARRPSWIVKFARVRRYAEPFERDEAGLALVAAAGGSAAERAPRLVGRFQVAGYEASVETAAVGARLNGVFGSRVSRTTKLRAVDAVAEWLVRVALETRAGPGSAAADVERLRRDVLPSWDAVDAGVLRGLDALPGVLQHNDLGGWNIVLDRDDVFAAVDWESARACGLPLWDLWYFLAHALVQIDHPDDDPVSAFRRLYRGDAPSSSVLFRWTRTAVEALGIPADAVGRVATLCWLHHGLSHSARADELSRRGSGAASAPWAAARYPDAWLEDPSLGTGWSRWQSG
jgi:hypothetical protein